jgi:hypothetical protein
LEKIEIRKYTKDLIPDVIDFEKRLQEEDNFLCFLLLNYTDKKISKKIIANIKKYLL